MARTYSSCWPTMDIRKFFSASACSPSLEFHAVDVDLTPRLYCSGQFPTSSKEISEVIAPLELHHLLHLSLTTVEEDTEIPKQLV